MPFGRLNAYAPYADIEFMARDRRLIILVLLLVIGLVMAKFLVTGISSAY